MPDELADSRHTFAARPQPEPPAEAEPERFVMRIGRPLPVVLALGAALGGICARLDRLGTSAIGLDQLPLVAARARADYPAGRFIAADLRALPFRDGSFDGIRAGAAPFRMPRALGASALAELHRVLRMGGILSLRVFPGAGQGLESTPHGPLYVCRCRPDELALACDALDMMLIESMTLPDGRLEMWFRREY